MNTAGGALKFHMLGQSQECGLQLQVGEHQSHMGAVGERSLSVILPTMGGKEEPPWTSLPSEDKGRVQGKHRGWDARLFSRHTPISWPLPAQDPGCRLLVLEPFVRHLELTVVIRDQEENVLKSQDPFEGEAAAWREAAKRLEGWGKEFEGVAYGQKEEGWAPRRGISPSPSTLP